MSTEQNPAQSSSHPRADVDPQVGDMIKLRRAPRNRANPARMIINITTGGDWIETVGMSGRQRHSTMARSRLAAYDRLERGAS